MSEKKYTKEHEWLAQAGDRGCWRVGISNYAQDELGDAVAVELPAVGREFNAGEEIAVIESVKAASDIYAPAAGRITVVNDRLAAEPDLINQSAEDQGWLFEFELSGALPAELLSPEAYRDLIG